MKKLVVILILFFSATVFAESINVKKSIKLHKDVMKGYKNTWRLSCTFTNDNKCLAPDYAFNIVEKKDNYPVRLGNKSVRFELRRGDCHQKRPNSYNDCKAKPPSERHELTEEHDKLTVSRGVTWHAHSMFLPENTPVINSDWITMGQFHNLGDAGPPVNFDLKKRQFQLVTRFLCQQPKKFEKNVSCNSDEYGNRIVKLISEEDLFGKWNDFVVNANWTKNFDKGFFKLWVNGKLAYHYQGRTVAPGNQISVQFGIYREAASKNDENATHVVFYDELRIAYKSCKKLKLEDLGYSCKELEKQKINNIHTISKPNTEIGKLSKEERYVKALTDRISKKIISTNSLPKDKAKKVIKWVNKELKKWVKEDSDGINTGKLVIKKTQSLTEKGIAKFK